MGYSRSCYAHHGWRVLGTSGQVWKQAMEQQDYERGQVAAQQLLIQAFIVSGEPAEAGCPGVRPFDPLPPGQQDKPMLDPFPLHYFQLNGMLPGGFSGNLPGVPLVAPRRLDRIFSLLSGSFPTTRRRASGPAHPPD